MDEIMTAGGVVAAQCHMGAVQSEAGSSLPLSHSSPQNGLHSCGVLISLIFVSNKKIQECILSTGMWRDNTSKVFRCSLSLVSLSTSDG